MSIALYGGAFDPPHNGHVALAEAALAHFDPARLLVLVAVTPGHRDVELDFEQRFVLARLAFGGLPRTEIVRDDHPRTVDALRAARYDDPIFLVGADQFAGFLSWKDPDGILELARVGVATRPGFPPELLEPVLAELARPDRVEFFVIPAIDASSTDIRAKLRRDEPVDDLVPGSVAREIEVSGFYR